MWIWTAIKLPHDLGNSARDFHGDGGRKNSDILDSDGSKIRLTPVNVDNRLCPHENHLPSEFGYYVLLSGGTKHTTFFIHLHFCTIFYSAASDASSVLAPLNCPVSASSSR